MPQYQVVTNWSFDDIIAFLCAIPQIAEGASREYGGLNRSILDAALHSVMGNLEKDFRLKADGGIGGGGVKWLPLSERRIKKRMQKDVGYYQQKLGIKFADRVKRGSIGNIGANLKILIDEGDLVESLSQGILSGAGDEVQYHEPVNQIVLRERNSISVDSQTSGAHKHQDGSADGRHPPQRRIVPDELPASWQDDMLEVVRTVICEFIVETLSSD